MYLQKDGEGGRKESKITMKDEKKVEEKVAREKEKRNHSGNLQIQHQAAGILY